MKPSTSIFLAVLATPAAAASSASHILRYSHPALRDFYEALPIGTGRLGAALHGHTDKELIRLNEESIWSGGPMSKIPPTARSALSPLREQILQGRLTQADQNWVANFTPEYDDMRRYQPAGELRIDFNHTSNKTSGYRHALDVSTGLYSLGYVFGGVEFGREAVGSFPGNVLAFRLFANKAEALDFDIALSRDINVTKVTADTAGGVLTLDGTGEEDDTYRFASKARLVLAGGMSTELITCEWPSVSLLTASYMGRRRSNQLQ